MIMDMPRLPKAARETSEQFEATCRNLETTFLEEYAAMMLDNPGFDLEGALEGMLDEGH